MTTREKSHTVQCPQCETYHGIDVAAYESLDELHRVCPKCIGREHRDYMRANAERFKMTCVPNCPCGYGADAETFYANPPKPRKWN